MNKVKFTLSATLLTTPDFKQGTIEIDIKSDSAEVEEKIGNDAEFAIMAAINVLAAAMASVIQQGASNGMDAKDALKLKSFKTISVFVDMHTKTAWMKRSKS